jgi:hypothetical protein
MGGSGCHHRWLPKVNLKARYRYSTIAIVVLEVEAHIARNGNRTSSGARMDVPFVSSGAISRAQYALVRKVESSDSTQSADHHILVEVANIRQRLAKSIPSSVRLVSFLMTFARANGLQPARNNARNI